MMQLSPNFSLAELTRSATADEQGIDNSPSDAVIDALQALCEHVLQPARDHFGPIRVLSGFRSKALNDRIGGARSSQHVKGEAADIEAVDPDISNLTLAQWITTTLPYDQLILEHPRDDDPKAGWVHVSYIDEGRAQTLTKLTGQNYQLGLLLPSGTAVA